MQRMTTWFYRLEHTTTPSPAERLHAQEVVEQVLRLDLRDEDGCERRLGHLIQWATQDEGFWKLNLRSLASLRAKRPGDDVPKWQKIESAMLLATRRPCGGRPGFSGAEPPRPAPKHVSQLREMPPDIDPQCTCEAGFARVEDSGRRAPCPTCERGRYYLAREGSHDR